MPVPVCSPAPVVGETVAKPTLRDDLLLALALLDEPADDECADIEMSAGEEKETLTDEYDVALEELFDLL